MRLSGGDRLGPYVVQEVLGQGGMGEVYRAHDPRLDRDLALKVLRVDAVDAETRRRFLQEAKAASALSHPGIVTVFDVGNQDGVDFIAMEFVEGTSLDRILERGPVAPARALDFAAQIADALARAHAAGIVHRDIKPANVVIDAHERIKVLDFGVAKVIDAARSTVISTMARAAATAEGALVGTIAYMSPEQAEGHAVDGRSDIFSLGAVLFEMLTGYPPFKKRSAASTLAAILHEPVRPLREIDPALPDDLERIVERCLRKDPGRRFQSMADLRVTLDDAQELLRSPGDPVAAGRAARTPPPLSTRWVYGALFGAAVAALVTLAVGRWRSPQTGFAAEAALLRITADAGFTVDPAVSPDGALVAFASDRGAEGGTNIWVQQVAGGNPLRVTFANGDEREPTFTPDGADIVFRSEVDGGLYVVPALGGEEPRLLVDEGRRPRVSPDGRSVAYWTGSIIGFVADAGGYRTYLSPLDGGPAREIVGFTGVRYPTWVEDSALLVLASTAPLPTADTYDWWLVPLDGGDPIRTDAFERLDDAGIDVTQGGLAPGTWEEGRVYFSDFEGLWSVSMSADGARVGTPERLTFGSARDAQPVAEGRSIAFISYISATNIWRLDIESNRGVLTGAPRLLTTGAGPYTRPTATADGRSIAYNSLLGTQSVLVADLETGRILDTGVQGSPFGSAISPDGATLAFENGGGVSLAPVRGGASRRLCEQCQVGDWARDGSFITVAGVAPAVGRLLGIDVATGEAQVLVEPNGLPLNRPMVSAGNRLLAFRVFGTDTQSVRIARLDRTPAPPSEWIAIGDSELDLRPAGWSPDGTLLYLLSGRDGYRCLYAQRVDPVTGVPRGSTFAVWHSHENRWLTGRETTLSTGPANAVAPGYFAFDRSMVSSDVWIMTGRQ